MKLILVGAGPGDKELITIKAVNALKKADVVLYDALANSELLDYCSGDCLKIYVGKKAGIHSFQQIFINDMIVDYCRRYGTVVRLKGGDPFVFGRGHEEMDHARRHGIEVEIVPGISSAIAAPAVNQIPLTRRGVNESFWVVAGTTINGTFSNDMALAAQSSATVVILMGMRNLSQILQVFRLYRKASEPVGIIQNGTMTNSRSGFGNLDTIEEVVKANQLSSPAIVIIGEVVNQRSDQCQIDPLALLASI